jgi:DNA-binding transcriptional LysR family regulator
VLELNELALFVEVVRAGSFAGAGRRLSMPANTVSRRIQALEERLGSRLMQRSTRKLSLTSSGQALYERCAAPVAELLDAGEAVREGGAAVSGLVRVAATAAFFESFAMEWVAQFMALHPQVRMEFMLSDARADLIADGIDLAFRGGPLDEASVVARKLQPVHFGLVASPAYIAARGQPASLRELAAHDCLVLSSRSGPVVWRFGVLDGTAKGAEAMNEVRVNARFGASIAGAVLQAALQGMGIAYLPSVLTGPEIETGRLVPVLPQHRREGSGMYAVLPSRRQVPRAVSAFLDFATAKIRATQAGTGDPPETAPRAQPKRQQQSRGATK